MLSSDQTQTNDAFWIGLLDAIHQAGDDRVRRRQTMHRLILHLQRSPNLVSSSHADYAIALNRTWEWLNQKIGEFDIAKSAIAQISVEKALVNWVNQYLRFRIKDLYQVGKNEISIDAMGTDDEGNARSSNWESKLEILTLSGLEAVIAHEQQQRTETLYEKMQHWVLTDPENKLKNCHPKANPNCNCQILAQRLALNDPPDKAAPLAVELGVNYQTLMTQWKRPCRRILQEQLQSFGYQPE